MAGEHGALALSFLAGLAKSVVTGLAGAKPPEQGCGSCPEKKRKYRAPKRRSR